MDRKSIIGLVLICLVFIGFGLLNRPSQEQIEQQKRYQDSIAKVEQAKKQSSKTAGQKDTEQQDELQDLMAQAQDNDSIREALNNQIKETYSLFSQSALKDENIVRLENDVFTVELSNKGGMVKQVLLKDYDVYGGKEKVKFFTKDGNNYGLHFSVGDRVINTENLYFQVFVNGKPYQENSAIKVSGKDSVQVAMRLYVDSVETDKDLSKKPQYIEYCYTLRGDDYRLGYKIALNNMQKVITDDSDLELEWNANLRLKEQDKKIEVQNSSIYYMLSDDVEHLKEQGKDDKKDETSDIPIRWISYKQQFFSTILIAKNDASSPNAAIMSTHTNNEQMSVREMSTLMNLKLDSDKAKNVYDFDFFFGPNKYRIFKNYQIDLEKTIPLGWGFFLLQWVNRFVIIPVFDFLQKFDLNIGLIILLLTLMVKLVLFPLAYKSYSSSAKMKVIQPEVEKINQKYPKQEQAMQKQQATMQLYKKAGINPMSGCLPLLLQFPILLAMYRFFPSSIELRQQPFLWADDLSTYDSILDLPFRIPLYGGHISLFCLLMTVVQLVYTKMTMQQQSQNNAMPGMKFMMYGMPIFMMFILNNLSAALNYYYLVSLLITIIQMLVIRKTINADKIMARLKENSKKPQKKSKWEQRIADLDKKNRQLVEERNRQQQKRKK